MKIIFYNETLMSGGIEKCIELLTNYLHSQHEIEIVYVDEKKLDPNIVALLSKTAKVHKLNEGEQVEGDICIWCRLYMDYEKLKQQIKANKNFLWVHSIPQERENYVLQNPDFLNTVDKIICISDTVKKLLPAGQEKATVIHNFLPGNIQELSNSDIAQNVFNTPEQLHLVTVSRLSNGKGFERVFNLVNTLKSHNVPFEYLVIGKGRAKEQEIRDMFSQIDEVKFLGYQENPYPYIKKADYLVQLSDFETWGNVITEAKCLGTPVITTSYDTAYEQVEDDVNGIIINLNDTNYEQYLSKMTHNLPTYKRNLRTFTYQNEIEQWNNLIAPRQKPKRPLHN